MKRLSTGLKFGIFSGLVAAFFLMAVICATPAKGQIWEEERLLLDLQTGGAELFQIVSPSIIEILNADYSMGWGMATGSGYVIDKEGHAITNMHVVGKGMVFEIAFFGDEDTGKRHKAILIGTDPQLDLAVIKINCDPSLLHPIKLADSSEVQIGDVVVTMGSPGGDAGTVDSGEKNKANANWIDFFNMNIGVVDEIMEFQHAYTFYSDYHNYYRDNFGQYYASGLQNLFHISAAINGGNSGGPCINAKGEVIGTNTWSGGGENVGYSVPVNLLKRSVLDIIQYGRTRTPWMGVICHPTTISRNWYITHASLGITNDNRLWFNPEVEEMLIYHVNTYSPAYKAGLRDGDIILSVDGEKFTNVFELYKLILNGRIGQEIVILVERNGNGIPPFTIKLDEKKVRFDSLTIDDSTIYAGRRPYHVELTY